MRNAVWFVIVVQGAVGVALAADDEPRRNVFNDPFLQVTHGQANCPVPPGPLLTEAEARAQAHGRAERGTSCYRAGRCRLPNSYLYDAEIVPRVQKAIDADGRFNATTSVWALGQRRWIWLQGCVSTEGESQALEALVRALDDVEGVVNELRVLP
ncbi:BON domain-containing protein [Ideonella sp. DXS29W]|uniref:BON domain-containing protein n=1 Tax=Ideonella lacteola TaxID=2984193 RepID=A0ABU9BQR9_9BURK